MLEENPDNTAPPDTVSPPPDHGPSGTLPPGADAHATPPGAGADVDIWLQRVRNLCLNAPGMIYQFQYFPDGRSCFPYASDSIRSIYEVEPAQVLHDAGPVLARVHPEDFDRVLETIRRSAETGEVWEDEYRVRLPERGLRWLWGKAQPEAQPDGSVTWHGYITDVTDRRAAQEALEVSRHRLNQLTESLKEVVWLRSADRRGMLYVNPAYERIWGRSCQSLNENPSSFLDAVHPEDKEAVAEGFRSYLETGRFQMEYRIIRPDGSVRWVEAESYPTDVGPDGVPGNVGRAVDISERRATNDALRESEERFRLISKYTSDPIVVVDGNFILVHVSTAHERVFGYGPAEFQGLPLDEAMRFVHPEDVDAVRRAVFEAIGRRESGAVYSFRFRTKDGRWIWREDSSSLLYDDQGRFRGAYVIARDLTAQKEQEEALRAAKDAAERANQAKTDFLANMSHELRTPLNGVIGFTDLLRDTPLSPIQSQYVSSIHTAGRALLDIINNVLDLSKIEAGKLELDPSHTDIIALAGGVADIVKYQASKKNLDFLLRIHPSVPRYAVVDAVRLKQILMNLLGNAVKFTSAGMVEMSVTFTAGEDGKRGSLRFTVKDTGMGISPEQRARLFKAFSQGDASVTRRFGGTGLGLVISNLLAEKMGSRIQVESEAGKGSTFWLEFQVEVGDEGAMGPFDERGESSLEDVGHLGSLDGLLFGLIPPPAEGSRAELEPGSARGSGERAGFTAGGGTPPSTILAEEEGARVSEPVPPVVLIVEDIQVNLFLARALVTKLVPDVQILQATNGQEALDVLAEERVDLVLMDVQMPGMDGLTATRLLRDREGEDQHIPVVALTAGALNEEQQRCRAAGMDGFLSKPLVVDALREVLESHLSRAPTP